MAVILQSLATATPTHDIAQSHAASLAAERCCFTPEHERLLPLLYRRTRVDRRGSVLLEHAADTAQAEGFFPPAVDDADRGPTTAMRLQRYVAEANDLAITAARDALQRIACDPRHVTHLVIAIIDALCRSRQVARTHVGFMGCHGALNGLRAASSHAAADPDARVLLCAVELCTLHFSYGWHPQRIVANALFADGAAAVVLGHGDADTPWTIAGHGSCVFPDSLDAMTWTIGDHGFEMTLSPRVPELISEHLRPWLTGWLARHDLTIDAVGSWAIPPGGPRIVSTAAQALSLAPDAVDASRQVLAAHGNMSSPTVLFIVGRLMKQDAPRPCVAMAFGPGLAVEAALLR